MSALADDTQKQVSKELLCARLETRTKESAVHACKKPYLVNGVPTDNARVGDLQCESNKAFV